MKEKDTNYSMTERNRVLFNEVLAFANQKYPNKNLLPSQSYLRVHACLKNSKNNYQLEVLKASGKTPYQAEYLLDKNDVFVATGLGIFLSKVTPGQDAVGVDCTFPDKAVFAAAAAHLEALYKGRVNLTVNSIQAIPALPILPSRIVSETQVAGAVADMGVFEWAKIVRPLPHTIDLRGDAKIDLNLEFPNFNGIAIEGAAPIEHHVVLFLEGFLLQGAAR